MGLQLVPSSFGMPGEATRTAGGCTALRPAACSGRAPRAALQGCAGPLEPSQQIYGWGDEHTPRALLPRQLGFLRNALIASSAINDPRGQSAPGRVLLPQLLQPFCSRERGPELLHGRAPSQTTPSQTTPSQTTLSQTTHSSPEGWCPCRGMVVPASCSLCPLPLSRAGAVSVCVVRAGPAQAGRSRAAVAHGLG